MVNFYRENIFLPQVQTQMDFRLYVVSDSGARSLAKKLLVSAKEMSTIKKSPSSFKIGDQGF